MAGYKPTHWLDCFTKLTNRELRALYRFGFTAVQLEIVLYVLAQTRGVGRIMAGELDGAGYEEWQEARDSYGREAAPLYRATVAGAINRHDKQVATELRRLIAAGVVIEHEAGRKGRAGVLSVDLINSDHWKRDPLRNRRRYSGVSALPKSVGESRDSGTRALPKSVGDVIDSASFGSPDAPESAPESAGFGSADTPESAGFGSADTPLFKRLKRETEDQEQETCDSGESHPSEVDQITSPRLKEAARRFLDRAGDQSKNV